MPGHIRSSLITRALLAVLLGSLWTTASAQIHFDLPSQPLAQALTAVGSLANLNIYFDSPSVDGIQAPALKAELSADDALTKLLAGTRLHAVRVDENTVRVVADTQPKNAQSTRNPATGAARPPPSVHLASAANAAGPMSDPAVTASDTSEDNRQSGNVLPTVLVTAEKRSERLQDVPIPLTAVNADTLTDQHQLRLQDYYNSVPGLSVATRFDGSPELTIRGISTGFGTNPTVGVTVDDVPYGSSTNLGGSTYVPDLDPSDLARVEVLRGPQGTLYGANSIGGLLKYVTVDPSTTAVSGHIQAGTSGVYHGDHAGYNVSGAINLPVNDTLAVRVSGFARRDPGYIDNVLTGQKGANELDVYGGRIGALWRPSEDFSLKLSALEQSSSLYGAPYVEVGPGFANLQQGVELGTGRAHKTLQAYSATATGKIGSVDVVSVTGYNINRAQDINDASFALGAGSAGTNNTSNYKFSEELRFSGKFASLVDWLAGGFYTHESTPYVQQILVLDPATAAIVQTLYHADYPTTYSEYAGFGDLTVHFTGQFDIQFGARESHIKETYSEVDTGAASFIGPAPIVNPEVEATSNSFTYLVTPRYEFTPDLMAYARFASGYRPGGPNQLCTFVGAPCQFGPDKTSNYDLGLKGDFLDHRLSIDASVYYISWRNIQLLLYAPGGIFSYNANAGSAKSQGIELSTQLRPLQGLSLSAWVAWNDAQLTEAFPPGSTAAGGAYGADGDRLPYSARFSGNFSVREDFPVVKGTTGFVGATLSYVGDRLGEFNTTPERAVFPGYAQLNLQAGAKFDPWTLSLFINNAADRRGVLYGGPGSLGAPSDAYFFIQPRTVGLSIAREF